MSSVELNDISLSEHTLDTIPLLRTLREEHFALKDKAEVCVERARFVTEYLKEHETSGDPPILRYAKALNHFLRHKEPLFPDANLLAGTTTSKRLGAPVYPELTGMTIWPELDSISTRAENPQILSKRDAEILNFEVYPYWLDNSILEYARRKNANPDCMKLFQKMIFFIASKTGCISHTVPNYKIVLERGLDAIIEDASGRAERLRRSSADDIETKAQIEFYEAVQIVLKGVLAYADSLSRKARKLAADQNDTKLMGHYLQMAEVCEHVPAKPAKTFREAVNSLWIAQIAVHAESINMAISPGRLDQILYKYYRSDIERGEITVRDAVELLGCLWLKLTDNTNLVPETAEKLFGGAGTVPAVTVGGIGEDGEDAVNDLTYVILRATELLQIKDPSLNARFHHEKNGSVYLERVCRMIQNTKSVPALHNDVVDIATLVNQGVSVEDARDYAIIGCVELSSAGRSYDASSSIMLNLPSVLELALYNGTRPAVGDEVVTIQTGDPAAFAVFDDFRGAFLRQLKFVIQKAIELNEMLAEAHQAIMPSPILSAFFDGPMEKGKDLIFGGAKYNSSGATHIGFADTVDSLNAIEDAVFSSRKCTFEELKRALLNNFREEAALLAYLRNRAPKYGSGAVSAAGNAEWLQKELYDIYQSRTNYRGGKYRPAYWSMTNHAGQGALTEALPNGRLAHESFASGITPVSQAAKDMTACLLSVASLDSLHIPGGFAFNLKHPGIAGDMEFGKFVQAVATYLKEGGMHIQFNIMSYRDLVEAKRKPAEHRELLVRVSGYSAYFNSLNDDMKDEIITRTEYDLRTGQANPVPDF